jgi:hypothetical protein
MPVLYDNANPATRRRTRVLLDNETLLPLIVSEQDVTPIVESAKRLASHFDLIKPCTGSDEWTLVARVDLNTWAHWTKLGITRDPKALDAVLDMRECAHFRTDDRRRLA